MANSTKSLVQGLGVHNERMLRGAAAEIKAGGINHNSRRPLGRPRHDLDQVGEGGGQVVVLGGVDGGDAGVLERPDSLRRRQLRRRLR